MFFKTKNQKFQLNETQTRTVWAILFLLVALTLCMLLAAYAHAVGLCTVGVFHSISVLMIGVSLFITCGIILPLERSLLVQNWLRLVVRHIHTRLFFNSAELLPAQRPPRPLL